MAIKKKVKPKAEKLEKRATPKAMHNVTEGGGSVKFPNKPA